MDREKYRFDDAYGKVYEYDEDAKAYLHIGSYLTWGINKKMSKEEMIKNVEREKLEDFIANG